MRVGIATVGTRGDVEPFVALAHALQAAGHEVTLAGPADAAGLAAAAQVRFVAMDFYGQRLMRSAEGQQWLASGDARAFLTRAAQVFSDARETIGASVLAVAEGADALVAGIQVDDYALAVAQARGLPLLAGYFAPWSPSGDFPSMLVSRADLRLRPLNRLTHRVTEIAYWRGKRSDINAYRRSLGLGPGRTAAIVWGPQLGGRALHAYSAHVVPRPRDWPPAQHVLTGYWRLPAQVRQRLGETDRPAGLVDWLDAGPQPFFLSFGSAPILDPAPMLDLAVEAARRARCRVLVGAGWTGFAGATDLPEQVHVVGTVDHEWLFPRCRGVIHHGGAGTTAAGLIAGRPTWVYSLYSDQPYWGARVTRLGAGGHSRFVDLDADRLTGSLRQLGRDDVRQAAAAVGERLRREDGLARAVREIAHVPATAPAR
ncbi:MAG TPA: glycosyltransferase [Micromonosporaceae bacterium]|nr:glycosyltransferase [Micromonosporaceae bacterium]